MDNLTAAVELTAATWEQFVAVALRNAHGERLLAAAQWRRCRQPQRSEQKICSANLLRLLLICCAGFWLPRY